jgi:flagellar basal-body rod protein FlgB
MPVSDIPILAMLRTRMAWGQERQGVLATVTNADTPRFKPRDLVPPDCGRPAPATDPVALVRTDSMHLSASGAVRRRYPPSL